MEPLGAATPEWLQQIPGTTELSVKQSAVVGTAKILHSILKLPGFL